MSILTMFDEILFATVAILGILFVFEIVIPAILKRVTPHDENE